MSSVSVRGLVPNDLNAVWRIHQEGNEYIAKQEPLRTLRVKPGPRREVLDDTGQYVNESEHLHQRTDLFSGNRDLVEQVEAFIRQEDGGDGIS